MKIRVTLKKEWKNMLQGKRCSKRLWPVEAASIKFDGMC
jgi:RNase P subunit RPR2